MICVIFHPEDSTRSSVVGGFKNAEEAADWVHKQAQGEFEEGIVRIAPYYEVVNTT